MAKHYKVAIYGDPGAGKSFFAASAPSPFFYTTDGNYEFLEDLGLKNEDHLQVSTWKEFCEDLEKRDFSKYETIVVDLLEDLYAWSDDEYCTENKIKHLSELPWGQGYSDVKKGFFKTVSKLIAKDKNIILLMHGVTTQLKDKRGVEYFKSEVTSAIPEKVLTQIEGRLRYFLRLYSETERTLDEGETIVNRYLSLAPDGKNEYGIARGLSGRYPSVIKLNDDENVSCNGWEKFTNVIDNFSTKLGTNQAVKSVSVPVKPVETKKEEVKVETPIVKEEVKTETKSTSSDRLAALKAKKTASKVEETKVETTDSLEETLKDLPWEKDDTPQSIDVPEVKEEVKPVTTGKVDVKARLAAIKAKAAK